MGKKAHNLKQTHNSRMGILNLVIESGRLIDSDTQHIIFGLVDGRHLFVLGHFGYIMGRTGYH